MQRSQWVLAAFLLIFGTSGASSCEWEEVFFWFYCPSSASVLLDASGLDDLSAPQRKYVFKVTCDLQERGWYASETSLMMGSNTTCDKLNLNAIRSGEDGDGNFKKTLVPGITVFGEATWDRLSGTVKQHLKLTGPVSAKVSLIWQGSSQCAKDPFLANEGVGCSGPVTQFDMDNFGADWGKYAAAFKRRRYPVFFRSANLGEAAAFSAKKSSGGAPPPPPPRVKVPTVKWSKQPQPNVVMDPLPLRPRKKSKSR